MKHLSASALAKSLGTSPKDVLAQLAERGLIEMKGKSWALTDKGKACGGQYRKSDYGTYIAWPENVGLSESEAAPYEGQAKKISATNIGKQFDLSPNKINLMLSELGWIKKEAKGWTLTEQGEKQGGQQEKARQSGASYIVWPPTIVQSKALTETVAEIKGTGSTKPDDTQDNKPSGNDFREKFEAKHRATDGHFVRSKAEMLIDNWLYMAGVVHAYERKLPIEEDVYSDFYIPAGKVYIEYWGYENDPKYLARKKKKLEIYEKYNFNLIELQDTEVQNLDDLLPKMLLKYGVQVD